MSKARNSKICIRLEPVCCKKQKKYPDQLKSSQNKKGQKNLGYPTKKQSFSLEKDCFFVRYRTSNFFGPSYFEAPLVCMLSLVVGIAVASNQIEPQKQII